MTIDVSAPTADCRARDDASHARAYRRRDDDAVELPYEIWERIIARIVRSEKFASYVEYVEHDTPEHYLMRLRGIDEEKLERVLISNIRDANYAAMLARQANDFRAKRCGKTISARSSTGNRFSKNTTSRFH